MILRVRRFLCGNPACQRQTFGEPLGVLLAFRARRTDRLAAAQGRVALVAGGEAGGRLLDHLGMPASPDTLLRLVRRMPLPPAPAPRAVGVDDWALRKGRTYGTILVDLRQCHAGGEPLLTISPRMRLARGTVRRYALVESFPERALPPLRPSILDPHLAHLDQRLAQGCENALALWRELRACGFRGTRRQVSHWLQPRRRAPSPFGPRPACSPPRPASLPPAKCPADALPSAKSLAWMMTRDPASFSATETAAIGRIAQDTEAAVSVTLVRRFADLVRGSSITATAS